MGLDSRYGALSKPPRRPASVLLARDSMGDESDADVKSEAESNGSARLIRSADSARKLHSHRSDRDGHGGNPQANHDVGIHYGTCKTKHSAMH